MIAKKYTSLLDKIEPFIFSNSENRDFMRTNVFGREVSNFIDCKSTSAEPFFNLLKQMDALAFGDQGMAMEGWVYFDCSAMPGAIVGFGLRAEDLPEELSSKFSIDAHYRGLIPISMFIAIPTMNNFWFGHNLSSLRANLGDDFRGLGLLTKILGIKVLKIEKMYGATQWGSPAINIHSKLAPMLLKSAKTLVHTHNNTLSYFSDYTNIDAVLAGKETANEPYDFLVKAGDEKMHLALQNRIEQGEELILFDKPMSKDGEVFYKIKVSKK